VFGSCLVRGSSKIKMVRGNIKFVASKEGKCVLCMARVEFSSRILNALCELINRILCCGNDQHPE